MTEVETIEGDVVEELANLPAIREATHQAVNLFGDASPATVVERATEAADALAAVVEQKELFSMINNRKHVLVEGWTLLGSMLGVFPVVEWTRQIEDGWEARVTAVTRNGDVIGAAESMCTRRERTWKTRDDYAIRSMAQTRAVSKALRHPLGFVMTLAGYEATPEAEMPDETGHEPAAPAQAVAPQGGNIQSQSAVRDSGTWAGIKRLVMGYGEQTWEDWVVFGKQAQAFVFGDATLGNIEKKEMLKLTSLAVKQLAANVDPSEFPPPSRADLREAWQAAIPDVVLEGPAWRMEPGETDRQTKEELDAAKEANQ